jgi:AraC-like DNA-binding protein
MGDLQPPGRLSIQYQGPARGQNYAKWREGICRAFCRLDAGPAENDYVDCRNEFAHVGAISLATPRGSSARFARTRDLQDDGCDDFVLISASHGMVRVTQGSKTIDISAGQMCLTEMNTIGAADLTTAGGFTTTRIPRPLLLAISPRAETQLARPLQHDAVLRAMIDRYFALCTDVAQDLDAVGQKAAAEHLVELVGLLLGAGTENKELVRQGGYTAVRLDLMKTQILRNLSKCNLSIEALAQTNGLSGRQAQRLFARSGTTYSEFVLEQRLCLARRLLLDASNRHRKISDIAYAAGFGDLSYFNRRFRKRFGVTPSDVRVESSRKQYSRLPSSA